MLNQSYEIVRPSLNIVGSIRDCSIGLLLCGSTGMFIVAVTATGKARNPSKPYGNRQGQARPGLAWPGLDSRPGLARPGQARPGQARPGQARPGHTDHPPETWTCSVWLIIHPGEKCQNKGPQAF